MAGGDRDRRGGILPDLRGALLRAPEALCPQERTLRGKAPITVTAQVIRFAVQRFTVIFMFFGSLPFRVG